MGCRAEALEQDEGDPQRRLMEMAKKLADSKFKERQDVEDVEDVEWISSESPFLVGFLPENR